MALHVLCDEVGIKYRLAHLLGGDIVLLQDAQQPILPGGRIDTVTQLLHVIVDFRPLSCEQSATVILEAVLNGVLDHRFRLLGGVI